MKAELVNAKQYGLEETQANEITKGLATILEERELLTEAYKDVMLLEIKQENLKTFRELRLQIRDNRTKGITPWKTANKAYFLAGGNFVQAIYNKEVQENERMEASLLDAEKHFEKLEAERVMKIQAERVVLLSEYVDDAAERDLSGMDQDVWESYLATKKQAYLDLIQAGLNAEKERQEKIEAEKAEQERIRKDNERLKAEAEAKTKQDKIESDKRAKIESDRLIKENAERKERERLAKIESDKQASILKKEREAKEKIKADLKAIQDAKEKSIQDAKLAEQAELNKGDSAKVTDLINDLTALKTKYSFKSAKNKKMYVDTCVLIDKVINHIG